MDRVNEILIQNKPPQPNMPVQEVYPEAGIGALENVVSGAPRQTMIANQPHMLAYINPQEEALIQSQRGGMPAFEGPGGVPAYWSWTDPSSWGDGKGYTGNSVVGKTVANAFSSTKNAVVDTVKEVATLGAADTATYNNGGGGGDTNYTVTSGDTLSDIATANDMSVGEIQAANPAITDTDFIQTGQILDLSGAGSGSATYAGGVGTGGIGSEPADVGGAPVVPVALNDVETILARDYGWTDNGDGTLTDTNGNIYNNGGPEPDRSFIPAPVVPAPVVPYGAGSLPGDFEATGTSPAPVVPAPVVPTGGDQGVDAEAFSTVGTRVGTIVPLNDVLTPAEIAAANFEAEVAAREVEPLAQIQ